MNRALGWIVLAMLAGCDGVGVKSRLASLDQAINDYAQALRWARYDDAQQFHMNRDGVRVALDEHAMKDIRITGYSVRETTFDTESTRAEVQAEFKFFTTSRGTLQTKVVPQTWWFDEDTDRWLLESGLPDFTVQPEAKKSDTEHRGPEIREVPRN